MSVKQLRAGSLVAACLLAACAPKPAPREHADAFVRGTARVISVDEGLGQALLEIDGRQVYGYWQKEAIAAQPGIKVQNGPLKAPVGEYREAEVKVMHFPAKAGETIQYVGMRTGNDIFLRGVAVVGQ